jgi:hypothetical protein
MRPQSSKASFERPRLFAQLLALDRVKVPPRDLDMSLLQQVLDREWRTQGAELVYVPLGFGDHHWRATSRRQRFFVTVRDLRLDGQPADLHDGVQRLETTFQAVRQLKARASLEFVVPAVPSALGRNGCPDREQFCC